MNYWFQILKNSYINFVIHKKISSYRKTVRVDADKSMSIRSFLIGSISQNLSTAKNVLESYDTL